jgi:hypothetical protein
MMAVHLVVQDHHSEARVVADMEPLEQQVIAGQETAEVATHSMVFRMRVAVAVVLSAQMWLGLEVVPLAETAVDQPRQLAQTV